MLITRVAWHDLRFTVFRSASCSLGPEVANGDEAIPAPLLQSRFVDRAVETDALRRALGDLVALDGIDPAVPKGLRS